MLILHVRIHSNMDDSSAILNACISILMVLGSIPFLFGIENEQVSVGGFNFFYAHYWILFFTGILLGISALVGALDRSAADNKNAIRKLKKDISKLKNKL